LTAHLRDDAAHFLALNVSGETPYRWQFRDTEDIVAGRVFGADEFSFADAELHVASPGVPFEIGLPLAYPIDLQRFSSLRVNAAADAAISMRVVAREHLDAPELVSTPLALAGNAGPLDLSRLSWEPAQPMTAAMLRLRFDLPRAHDLRLAGVVLQPRSDARRVDPTHTVSAKTLGWPLDRDALSRYDREVGIDDTPIIPLAKTGRVEQRLLALREIRALAPAAIVVPEEAQVATLEQARLQAAVTPLIVENPMRWVATVIFALMLGLSRLRPQRNARARALLEIALVLAVPLWLTVGGHFTGRVDAVQIILIGATALYALALGRPRTWTWNGQSGAWLLAAGVTALALCIGFALHRADTLLRATGTAHVIRYLGWALIQQYLICGVCLERWRIVTGAPAVALYLSALAFALLHTPNATLMIATFIGGLCWCALYLRERALLPLAFSHAASALILIALLPPDILLSAEVSARFFQ
jgi:membrane protease YdiL (CAAX protease family)